MHICIPGISVINPRAANPTILGVKNTLFIADYSLLQALIKLRFRCLEKRYTYFFSSISISLKSNFGGNCCIFALKIILFAHRFANIANLVEI